MTKRRRGNRQTHYQVPSLQTLAANAIRGSVPNWRHTPIFTAFKRRGLLSSMDSEMSAPSSSTTQSKRARTDTADGAREAGSGLAVAIPRAVPHCYNNNYTVRLTYADTYRHDINYGNSGRQVFRTNSIFDPDYTGSGHQPLFRDLWASQYDYYTVLSCDYELQFYNGGVASITYTAVGNASQRPGSVLVHTLPTTNVDDYVTNAAVYPIAEMKNVTTKFLMPEDVITITGTLTPGDFMVDAKDADSDNTWVANGSNPNVPRYLGYVLTSANNAAFVGQNNTPFSLIQVFAKLHYTVQFTQIAPSLRQTSS